MNRSSPNIINATATSVINLTGSTLAAGPVAVSGYDLTTNRLRISLASSTGQAADFLLLTSLANNKGGDAYKSGQFTSTLNTGSAAVGDAVYLATDGTITLTPNNNNQIIGRVKTTETNGVITGYIQYPQSATGSVTTSGSPASGQVAYFTSASAISSSSKLTFDNTTGYFNVANGRQGIMQSSPEALLDVKTDSTGTGSPSVHAIIVRSSEGTPRVGMFSIGGGSDVFAGTTSAHRYNLISSGSPRVIIEPGGNVGVGPYTFPTGPASLFSVGDGSPFQVNTTGDMVKIKNITYSWPTAQAGGASYVLSNNGSGVLSWAAGAGNISGTGTAGQIPYFTNANTIAGTDNLFWDNTNRFMGIGTNAPGTTFVVRSNDVNLDPFALFANSDASTFVHIGAGRSGDPVARFIFKSSMTRLDFGTQTAPQPGQAVAALMTLLPNGNFGVNNTNPTNKFHVGSFSVDSSGNIAGAVNYTGTGTVATAGLRGTGISTKTANYTATDADFTILCDANSGGFTITLPAAASHSGRIYNIKKIDSSGNTVVIDGNASETIDGATTVSITVQWVNYQIQSDGTNWFII